MITGGCLWRTYEQTPVIMKRGPYGLRNSDACARSLRRLSARVASMPARRTIITLGALAVLIVGVRVWGLSITDGVPRDLKLRAIPFYGHWRWDGGYWEYLPWLAVPAVAGVALAWWLPSVMALRPWKHALALAALGSVAWSLALELVDRRWDFTHDFYGQHIHFVDDLGGPGGFLDSYVQFQESAPIHMQAHPPGLVLGFWAFDAVGMSGVLFEVGLTLAAVAVSTAAALVIARDVVAEPFARRAAAFVALAPAAVWHTNADVIFAAVVLSGVALVTLASGRGVRHERAGLRSGWQTWALAAGGGALFGTAMLMTYGVAMLALVIAAVTIWRRQWWVLVTSAAAGATVVGLPLVWGYWYLDGLAVTQERYDASIASDRPYLYFLVANLAVFAVAIGPAAVVALTRLRDQRAWILVGAAATVVVLAGLSGLSKAETERIWQPFMPLVLMACGALHPTRRWLVLQVAVALAVQGLLRTPW